MIENMNKTDEKEQPRHKRSGSIKMKTLKMEQIKTMAER
jgi:hypothetical protein